jgi:hypothetical protein
MVRRNRRAPDKRTVPFLGPVCVIDSFDTNRQVIYAATLIGGARHTSIGSVSEF